MKISSNREAVEPTAATASELDATASAVTLVGDSVVVDAGGDVDVVIDVDAVVNLALVVVGLAVVFFVVVALEVVFAVAMAAAVVDEGMLSTANHVEREGGLFWLDSVVGDGGTPAEPPDK